MASLLLTSNSKEDLNLLKSLAKKLGISIKELNDDDLEEKALLNAIKEGMTGKYIDEEKFLKKLKK